MFHVGVIQGFGICAGPYTRRIGPGAGLGTGSMLMVATDAAARMSGTRGGTRARARM